ncbi:ABC transporter permease [Negadavirga shengliensis]|uniref:ABC transporter permease n=1 Tax=Negadavirga shengliensis TaxID=1389218 RepID=A0ABV9SWQ2_9BACT
MWKNYLKIAWRNLLKNKGYSFINIGGLALGMAVAILNGLWIWDELSFNKYHDNYDRVAQIAITGTYDTGTYEGEEYIGTTMVYPLGTKLIDHYKEDFEHIVRISWNSEQILSSSEKSLAGTGHYVDEGAPELFTFKMTHGFRAGLKNTHSIMLSASMAKALFGGDDPINKVIRMNNKTDVTVTGVYEDFPHNSKFHHVNFFAPWDLFLLENKWIEENTLTDWRNHFIQIYVQIPSTSTFHKVSDKIKDVLEADPADAEQFMQQGRHVILYPMSRWHLFPPYTGPSELEPVKMVWLVGSIGMFVLLLACINFMNLSTARSEKRAKEVGVRKTVGSARNQLIYQFFSESFLVVILAFAVALLLVALLLPWFNGLAAKQMVLPWSLPGFWLLSGLFILFTGLLAGSYPALFLSSFQPVKALKGTFRLGPYASVPRKVLVVIQFSISIVLIIGTTIIYQQIQFGKNRPVGYSREGLITMQMKSEDFYKKYESLRTELKNTGLVEEMSGSMGRITQLASGNGGFDWEGKDPNNDANFGTLAITHEHGNTIGWQVVEGRDFSREFASDSSGMVINEAAAKQMGLENPVGQSVTWNWWEGNREPMDYKILGVIKDMVMESPYEPVKPTVFYIKGHNGRINWINIRMNPKVSISEALPKIEAVFKKIIPSVPFDYSFVDEEYKTKFTAEEQIGKLTTFFGILAVFISCLGLFGLASYVAEQRTKEIGIRQILGATVANLWGLLSKEFMVLVIISCVIAIPISSYFMKNWLDNFVYRTNLSVWIFAGASLGAFLIALSTVSFQILKAVFTNPVESLRSE